MADMELLRQYAHRNSEEAFAALVTRHVNLVYSAALRKTGNAHAAEEITQAVFIILAKKADRLRAGTILSGWLYQTARLTSASFLRNEIRRVRREQEAYMQSLSNETEPNVWPGIEPLLEDAMGRLGEKDRNALVLRFFERKSFQEIGVAFGASENAAKKRVAYALEKLRKTFLKRGVASMTTIIAGAISANSIQAAPVALAKSVTVLAIAKGATASGSTLTLIKGALKFMAWTKAKTAIVVGVGVLLAAGTTTIAIKEIQENRTYPWQVPRADFSLFYKTPPQVKIVPTRFDHDGGFVTDGSRGTMGIDQPVKEIVQLAYKKNHLRTVVATEMPSGRYDFLAKLVSPPAENTNWTVALQKEITKKFGITGRLEMRKTDVMLLTPSNTGIRNVKESHKMPSGMAMKPDAKGYSFYEQPISTLADMLEQRLQIPIVDQTGLTNTYDFTIPWKQDWQNSADGLKIVIRDQLGLELVSTNMPIEMLVVEKVK